MLTKEELNKIFVYNNGELFWKISNSNRVRIGDKAGSIDARGYMQIGLFNEQHRLHRIIWQMHFGNIPDNLQIDHVDRNRLNNKLENLRLANNSQNMRNTDKRQNTSSKYKGVSWHKRDKKWHAKISIDNTKYYIAQFDNEIEASNAYQEVLALMEENLK
jgi:hypothetical protein